jgi:hypothetical protein
MGQDQSACDVTFLRNPPTDPKWPEDTAAGPKPAREIL